MWRIFYHLFRAITGVSLWMHRRFTRAGLLAVCALVLTAVFGVDTSLTVAYQIFTFLAALLAIALISAGFGRTPLAVQALMPRTLTAGEPFSLRFSVRNTSDAALDGAALRAELSDPRPAFAEFRSVLTYPTYGGWLRLVAGNRIADLEEIPVPALVARGATESEARGRARRRGRLQSRSIDSARSEALGLMRKLMPAAGSADIYVLPKRYPLPMLTLPGTRRNQPGGLPQGSSVGDSEEFLGLRDYRPGDPLQRIHWRSFARTGKPVVKEYQDEFVARHALILDTHAGEGAVAVEAFEEAVAVAASFAWTIDTQDCLLDLMFVGGEVHTFTAGHGYLLPEHLLEVLAGVAMKAEDDFQMLADAVRGRREQLSGCVCILLRWDERRRVLLDALRASGASVLPLLIAAQAPQSVPPGVRVLHPGRIAEGLAGL